jgi:hypothetical protein
MLSSARSSLVPLLGAILVLGGLDLAGCGEGDRARLEGPFISVRNATHDIGTVYAGEPVRFAYVVENEGSEDLHILEVTTTCGCATTGEYDHVVAPSGKIRIPMVVTTLGFGGIDLDKAVTIRSDDPRRPLVRLRLRGRIRDRIRLEPRSGALMGRVLPGAEVEREILLTNEVDTPLHLALRPGTGNEAFSSELETLVAGQEYRLRIRFRAPEEGGSFRENIVLETGIADPPTLAVHCSALVPRRIEVVPPSLVVASGGGEEVRRSLRVVGVPGAPLRVTATELPDPRVEVSVVPGSRDHECEVRLVFPPDLKGEGNGMRLILHTDDEKIPILEVPIRILDRRLLEGVSSAGPGGSEAAPANPHALVVTPTKLEIPGTAAEARTFNVVIRPAADGEGFRVASVRADDEALGIEIHGPGADGVHVLLVTVPGGHAPPSGPSFLHVATNDPRNLQVLIEVVGGPAVPGKG